MMLMTDTHIQYRVFRSFEDAAVSPLQWNELVEKYQGHVFMTWHYQKTWWEVFGRGALLIVTAFDDERPIAVAPLFTDAGMIYFVGSGGSDYLHFIGALPNTGVLRSMLKLAANHVPGFLGFLFYHVPLTFRLQKTLIGIAEQLQFKVYLEGEQPSPGMSIKEFPQIAGEATRKKSLLRHEAWFKRNGNIEVKHLSATKEILPWLEAFFDQHKSRWAVTEYPSLFNDAKQCLFYTKLAEVADESGWLRFTVVLFNARPAAFHFGFLYNDSFLWYKPSFDMELAKHSPGEVLLRHLLMYAIEQEAEIFDFGLGDEAFKQRFATYTHTVQNIGMYPETPIKKQL